MIEAYLQSFKVFSDEEIRETASLFSVKTLAKNEFFVKEGDKCGEIAFIRSGVFRSFYFSEGNDVTYCFRFPNDLMAAYSSFITGNRSQESMQAISNAELLVIRKEALDELVAESNSWTKFLKTVAEQQYLELEKRVFDLQKQTAAQRYTDLIENQPAYIQQIPLQYLASYLGITQRHLSRIRKEISFGHLSYSER